MPFFSRNTVKTLPPQEVKALLDSKAIHLVDVREAHEWSDGHIPGAIHLPLSELSARVGDLPEGKPVVLYCLSGGRSGQAFTWLKSAGHPVEAHMGGGISGWRREGLPVTRD
ncbi:rhodanese-like domain-containing protein [Pleomorphomonas koreensis]|uniref:rhodanese-like domain-containing protein n=1 Tax=Pleomorphomonas koreensis TaxID=257440 RepID=UPI000414D9C9|nr:rhodanese-like domain-containing protein [Pleomorphomonas koreensis]